MYILTNQSDEQLERLLEAIRVEQDKRTLTRINEFPIPASIGMERSLPHCIMDYRDQCKMAGVYVSVSQARAIILHYRAKKHA